MSNIGRMQGTSAILTRIYPKKTYKELNTRRCKFYDEDGFCAKQQMKCPNFLDNTICDLFIMKEENDEKVKENNRQEIECIKLRKLNVGKPRVRSLSIYFDEEKPKMNNCGKEKISENQYKIFLQCKKTAGCWFIVGYLRDIEENYDKLMDMDFKRNYANTIFHKIGRDCRVENTIVRINCMLRLIDNGLADYAYNYAINSNWY